MLENGSRMLLCSIDHSDCLVEGQCGRSSSENKAATCSLESGPAQSLRSAKRRIKEAVIKSAASAASLGSAGEEKGLRNFPNPAKTTKNAITRHIRIQITHF